MHECWTLSTHTRTSNRVAVAVAHVHDLPKFVVNGGNDEFFLPDDNHYWWDDLPGEKHLLHIPDADHPLCFWPLPGNGSATFEAAAAAFYAAVVADRPRPTFTWRISADGAEVTAGNFTEAPSAVTVWSAVTRDGYRDWRLSTCRGNSTPPDPGNCTDPEGEAQHHPVPYEWGAASPAGDGTWRASAPAVPTGQFAAFFLSAEFAGGFRFTTQVSIVPAAFPYAPCSGKGCNRLV